MFGICVPSIRLRITSQMSRFMLYTHVCAYAILGHQTIIYTPSTFTCTCTYYIYICMCVYACIYIYIHIRMECHVVPRLAEPLFPSCPFCSLFSLSFLWDVPSPALYCTAFASSCSHAAWYCCHDHSNAFWNMVFASGDPYINIWKGKEKERERERKGKWKGHGKGKERERKGKGNGKEVASRGRRPG